jgi:hypothetical protein
MVARAEVFKDDRLENEDTTIKNLQASEQYQSKQKQSKQRQSCLKNGFSTIRYNRSAVHKLSIITSQK